jgi:hypothetical protein
MSAALTALWGARGLVLQIAPWAIAGLCLLGALWYRGEYQKCAASVAGETAKAEAQANAWKQADAKHTRALERQLAPVTKAIEEQANATQIALARVPSNPSCAHTPAADAFDGSVRPAARQTGAGAARPAGARAH